MRERGGSTLPAVFNSESAALGWIASRVPPKTRLVADEAASWNDLHARFAVDRIDYSQTYSLGGVYSNGAEEFFSRMHRAEIGHHHRIWSVMRRRARGARIIDGSPMASRSKALWVWRGVPAVCGLVRILAAGRTVVVIVSTV
jgi:hypothetical protein